MNIRLSSTSNKINACIDLPASKSISNRALILQALEPNIQIKNNSKAEDTEVLKKAISQISETRNEEPITLNTGDAGTAFRFLAAFLASNKGSFSLYGSARMHQRPIKELVDVLRELGASISYIEKENFPPLHIVGQKIHGGKISVNASVSSQFISALMLIAARFEKGIEITLEGDIVSESYILMTKKILDYFEVSTKYSNRKISIVPQKIIPKEITISADWSSASYYYAICALSEDAKLFFPNLFLDGMQGDEAIHKILAPFGVKTIQKNNGIEIQKIQADREPTHLEFDFTNCPDIAQTVIVFCACKEISGKFTGLKTLLIKETNRIEALQKELSKFGATLDYRDDILSLISKKITPNNTVIETYNDHRMAMSMSILATKFPVLIEHAEVVKKSNPDYWKHLEKLRFSGVFT